jgi:hypothetical protein
MNCADIDDIGVSNTEIARDVSHVLNSSENVPYHKRKEAEAFIAKARGYAADPPHLAARSQKNSSEAPVL